MTALLADAAFRPNADRGSRIYCDIKLRLVNAIREIVRGSRGYVALDETALNTRIAEIESAPVIRPDVFLLYYDCLAAARANDLEALTVHLAELTRAPVPILPFRFRNYADDSFLAGEAARYLRALNADPTTPVAVGPAAPAHYQRALKLLARALEALERAAPEIAGEIRVLEKEIVLVEDTSEATLSFDGATSFHAWGALFLNAAKYETSIAVAEALAHESAHAHLYGLSLGNPLVENPNEERYQSPLRNDPRPMDGIFHAVFVSARMHYALDRLVQSDVLDAKEREDALRHRAAARCAFFEGHAVVAANARPTELGRAVMHHTQHYMESAAA